MYTSIKDTNKYLIKTVIIYLIASAFCGVFSIIYEHFSHGVYSGFMVWLFAYPLVGGALPYFVIYFLKLAFPKRIALNLYNSGICTLTVGSCMNGIFEIYGSNSSLLIIYWIAGSAFAVTGLVIYAIEAIENYNNKHFLKPF